MVALKLTVLMLCGLLVNVIPTAAQNACHSDSPACRSRNPDSTLSFSECCVADQLLRQASYGSGPGRSCIRCATLGCHEDMNCASETGSEASNVTECCARRGMRSFRNPIDGTCQRCPPSTPEIYGDPHFIVPLPSKEVLCYSIQGYPGLAFNLIHNKNFIINAQFVDSMGDTTEATWIGKLAVIPQNATSSNPVIFDSVNHQVIVVGQGSLSASMIKEIIFNENGLVKFTQAVEKQSGNPTVHVTYSKQQADFDVTFHTNHLNVNWNFKYDDAFELPAMHGIIGQFMRKGVDIDVKKSLLTFSDGRDPVPVIRDSSMTGNPEQQCWKAMNYGNQGEGLLQGKVLDYMVAHILDKSIKF